jgi:hypothetical protein
MPLPDQPETQLSAPEIAGIFTIAEIDKFTFSDIEAKKKYYLMNLYTFGSQEAIEQLSNLYSVMLTMLEKYFGKDEITATKINEANFYDLKTAIDVLVNEGIDDKEPIRLICEIGYKIYNEFIKRLGVALPTARIDKRLN